MNKSNIFFKIFGLCFVIGSILNILFWLLSPGNDSLLTMELIEVLEDLFLAGVTTSYINKYNQKEKGEQNA